jgi:hypothetical protein
MADDFATESRATSGRHDTVDRLFVLELSGGRIHSMRPDGFRRKVIAADCHLPDGIAVDVEAGHIYLTRACRQLNHAVAAVRYTAPRKLRAVLS